MTLITQFKNDNLSFIASDGATRLGFKNQVCFKNNSDKVFKCHNTIIGVYGDENSDLIEWLKVSAEKYCANEICIEL